jgi:hypothetical protein
MQARVNWVLRDNVSADAPRIRAASQNAGPPGLASPLTFVNECAAGSAGRLYVGK